jgi:3',5'-cyclic AMP phosphodiesterase CpdA
LFRLAHISDPHLPPPRDAYGDLSELASKRTLSRIAWRKKRGQHDPAILARLIEDVRDWRPDHIALTGDLTNFSTQPEFDAARIWLQGLGDPRDITVSPGNHDALVDQGLEARIAGFAPWFGDEEDGGFPHVRRRGLVALVNLRSAVPTALQLATGRLGATQLERLAVVLGALGREGLYRVVMLHHPPVAGVVSRRKSLDDAEDFRKVIGTMGAELVLHGHAHEAVVGAIGPTPVLGVPSASATPGHHHPAARWHGITVSADGAAEVIARGFDAASGGFAEVGRYVLPAINARSAA